MAGPTRTYVGSVKRGERNISIDNIAKLAAALGVEMSELLKRAVVGTARLGVKAKAARCKLQREHTTWRRRGLTHNLRRAALLAATPSR